MKGKILVWAFGAMFLLLGACGDDDTSSKKEQFAFDGETFSLTNAKVYLTDISTFEGRTNREYIVTDGSFVNNQFTGYTYFIELELATAVEETEFSEGEYPQWYYWDDAPTSSEISYLEVYNDPDDMADYFYFWTPEEDGTDDHDPIVVSGGFDDGETITFELDGGLTYEYFDSETEEYIESPVTGKFYVKGEIDDITSSTVPARKSKRERRIQ